MRRAPAGTADPGRARPHRGQPVFAQQIARLLAAQGVPLARAQVTGVSPVVGDVLARRLARLPGKIVDLLAVASVVGRRFPIATVAAIAGVPAETALPLLDSAVRAAVLEHDEPGRLRFSHDLFRDVLYDGLSAARRSALHLTVAELLERHTAAAEIAYHRSVAWPLGDRDRAVTALTGAAARARATGDTDMLIRAAFGVHRITTLTESPRSGALADVRWEPGTATKG